MSTLRSPAEPRAPILAAAPRWRCLLLSSLALASACASRSLPISYPANAASSAQAPEARPADVLMALSGEPPFETAAGEPAHSEPPAVDHSQHHGGHHHGAH